MKMFRIRSSAMPAALIASLIVTVISIRAYALDPANTVGPDECIDCHAPEHDVWEDTTHYKTYDELSLSDLAAEIAEALEIDDIEAPDGTCVNCHFTLVGDSADDAEPVAGISCESCHGAAGGWIDSHGEYPGEDPESESPDQRAARIAAAEDAGMIRSERIDKIAPNCLSCHTVPNEQLVNVGGHPAGSDFELVAWSQGEVRHNLFWNDGDTNAEASPERQRVFYVVGHATDLEFSLRALAKSVEGGAYREAMAARIDQAVAELETINQQIDSAPVADMLAAAGSIDVGAPDPAAIEAAAEKVSNAIQTFASSQDGSTLSALDSLLPAEGHHSDKY